MNNHKQLAAGLLMGVFIAWGCSTGADMMDAGAQGSAITWQVLEGACAELESTTTDSGSTTFILGEVDPDRLVQMSDVMFQPESNPEIEWVVQSIFPNVVDGQIRAGGLDPDRCRGQYRLMIAIR